MPIWVPGSWVPESWVLGSPVPGPRSPDPLNIVCQSLDDPKDLEADQKSAIYVNHTVFPLHVLLTSHTSAIATVLC